MSQPVRLLVYSSIFPSSVSPTTGTPVWERMSRIGRHVPMVVVSPQAWSPLDWFVRLFRKTFRPIASAHETIDGVEIFRPRMLSIPRFFKSLDGWLMAAGSRQLVRRIVREFRPTILDAHFLYPDGYAASLLAREHGLPLTITIRGSKDARLVNGPRKRQLRAAMESAATLFAVAESLKQDVPARLGIADAKTVVIGNGVDMSKFSRVEREAARQRLGIAAQAKVLISVGSLVELKGFHRILPVLPRLRERFPGLRYLVVGGGTTQGDMSGTLRAMTTELGLEDCVVFCGPQPPEQLKWYYSAADLFVSATSYEGWANVLLEGMACGLPAVTTNVGGNPQVVCRKELGAIVPYWDAGAFEATVVNALQTDWDRSAIMAYARDNSWDARVAHQIAEYQQVLARCAAESPGRAGVAAAVPALAPVGLASAQVKMPGKHS
jgi:teichuronic acid biosynthesis glycosyltransferase TuaC